MAGDMPPQLWGAISAVIAAALTFVGTRRAQRSDATTATFDRLLDWADRLEESEEKCRTELDRVRVELAGLRAEVRRLQAAVGEA